MFQDNPLSGALFLAADRLGIVCRGRAAGAVRRLACRRRRRRSPRNGCASTPAALRAGLYGFNGVLVGLALATFIAPGPLLWVYVVLGAAVSVVAMVGHRQRGQDVGHARADFSVRAGHVAAAARDLRFRRARRHRAAGGRRGRAVRVGRGHAARTPAMFVQATLLSISQVFLKGSVVAALLFLAGLAVNSLAPRRSRPWRRDRRRRSRRTCSAPKAT